MVFARPGTQPVFMMKRLIFAAATLALVGCAELELEEPTEPALTVGQSVIVESADGSFFEVSVVHDGSLTPVGETTLLDNVGIVGLTPVDTDITPVGADPNYVPPIDPVLVPDEDRPINIYIVGIDADLLLGNYRWGWIDEIDEEDLESNVEDICPPWH